MITEIEVDLTPARINSAGEISWVKITARGTEETKTFYVYTTAKGIYKGGCHPYSEDATVAVNNFEDIEITEEFAMTSAEILKINLEGRVLEEHGSTPKIRKFLPVGRRKVI